MAQSSSAPALPSTADSIPYVPVSWMAVAAFTVASLFVIVLLALGISAFLAKKPLIQDELLALPAIGIVLSFAARRVIRNSEGTRAGERLANTAWWICVISGLSYAAYLAAIAYSIRRDAKSELEKWVGNLLTPDETSFNRAFLRTRDPSERSKIDPTDTPQIEGRFRDEYLGFKQGDLIRIARRNAGDAGSSFTSGGVREWSYRSGGIDCVYSGVLKCSEGTFPVMVALRGADASSAIEGAGRQWVVMFNQNGFFVRDQVTMTRYGWLMRAFEESGGGFGTMFLESFRAGNWAMPYVYQSMVKPDSNFPYWHTALLTTPGRLGVTGGMAAVVPYTKEFFEYSFPDRFFKLPGGREPSPEQRAQFKTIWENAGLLPSGGRLRNSPDKQALLTLTDTSIEVRVPCELPLPGVDTNAAARGRIVVVSTDPALLAELKQLRAEANPDVGTAMPPEELFRRDFKWRIARIESDLVRVVMQQRPGEGGPPVPAPGGMPGH